MSRELLQKNKMSEQQKQKILSAMLANAHKERELRSMALERAVTDSSAELEKTLHAVAVWRAALWLATAAILALQIGEWVSP